MLAWLDRGIRLGLVAYGVVHLLTGWLGLQLAFGDRTERPSSAGAMQELARQPFGEVVVLAIVGGLFVLVVWRLLELPTVGHRDKAPGVHRWRARAVSGFKGSVHAASPWQRSATARTTPAGASRRGTPSTCPLTAGAVRAGSRT